MKKLKENKPLRYMLTVVLFVLLCCNLPSLALCSAQDIFRPPNTEILVSACKKPVATGVPGGEVLLVREGLTDKLYLLDLRTGEKRTLPNDPLLLSKGIFLSSDLVWLEGSSSRPGSSGYRPHYILDLTDGKRYELLDLTWLPLKDNKFDPKNYTYIETAEQVYLHHTKNRVIALTYNFRENPENNVIFSQSSLGGSPTTENGRLLERLLRELEINYEVIDLSLQYADVPSPNENYVVSNNGIYTLGTNTLIVPVEFTGRKNSLRNYFKSWYFDEHGIIVQEVTDYLINSPLLGTHFPIRAPILKVNLPLQ
ncbi:MAG: hypothetical protein KF758_02185 [Anaerolineales bacterium]|nr:hypothetical protein [Anaerolineales bacterium]